MIFKILLAASFLAFVRPSAEIGTPVVQIEASQLDITDEEILAIALLTLGEAEGESELGKRLVIDTVLNRVDSSKFPNDILSVVYQSGQYSGMGEYRQNKVRNKVTDELLNLVKEEIINRTNDEVLYFRTKHYHKFGTPVLQEDHHYFSK